MPKTMLGLIALFALSSCCPFGYTQDTDYEWSSNKLSANEVQRIRSACQAEANKKAVEHQNEFLQLAKQACGQKQPFAHFQFIGVDGQPYGDARQASIQKAMAANVCADLQQTGKISTQNLQTYCYQCGGRQASANTEACYRASGLRLMAQAKLACKPMKLF